jgi:Putative beta barrel porin-7 (BBP7)
MAHRLSYGVLAFLVVVLPAQAQLPQAQPPQALPVIATPDQTGGRSPVPTPLPFAQQAEGEDHKAEGEHHKAEGEHHKAEGEHHKAEGEHHEGEGEHPEAEPFLPKAEGEHEAEHEEHKEEELLPFHRIWARGEYLLWRIRNSSPPLLATNGSAADVVPGAVGGTGTTPQFGGATLNNSWRSGARVFLGGWFDGCEQYGAEASYLFLGSRNVNFYQSSDGTGGSSLIARPFFNSMTGQQDASLVAFPGLASGALSIVNASRMEGSEANGVVNLYQDREFRLDALAGFRWVFLKEFLRIQETVQVIPGAPVFPGEQIGVQDYFGASNYFYGGQIGMKGTMRHDNWSIDVIAKVAAGSMVEVAAVNGGTVFTPPGGAPQAVAGGLFALSSNMGQFHRDMFAVVPEVDLQGSYHITENIHATAGFTYLYLSNVARPGELVDVTVNPNLVPASLSYGMAGGPARPGLSFHGTDFFAYGVYLGLTFQY